MGVCLVLIVVRLLLLKNANKMNKRTFLKFILTKARLYANQGVGYVKNPSPNISDSAFPYIPNHTELHTYRQEMEYLLILNST